MLTCNYEYEMTEPGQWCYEIPNDFTKLNTSRRKRCCSCKKLIDRGAECLEFKREKIAHSYVEENIYGEGELIPINSWWMCEQCGEIFLNLSAINYCPDITEPMERALHEYWDITGFKPNED